MVARMADAMRDRGLMIVLAYLWPLAIIPLLASRDDPEVQWHAKHGLILMVAEALALILFIAISAVGTLASFVIGCILSVFIVLALIAILALHALAIIKGLNGKRLYVPGVSDLANRF
jgi:uncharacterized membrane protein